MDSPTLPLPPITDALVKALSQRFPDRCPTLQDSDREVWFKAGQRSVIDFLIAQKLVQDENILTSRKE